MPKGNVQVFAGARLINYHRWPFFSKKGGLSFGYLKAVLSEIRKLARGNDLSTMRHFFCMVSHFSNLRQQLIEKYDINRGDFFFARA